MAALVTVLLFIAAALAAMLVRTNNRCKEKERSLAETREQMDALLHLSKALEVSTSYSEIINAVDIAVNRILGIKNVWIYLTKPETPDLLHILTASNAMEAKINLNSATLPVKGDAMIEEIVNSRHAVVVEDARTDPRTNKEIVARMDLRSVVNVQMLMADRLVGALGVGTYGAEGVRRFRPEEIAFLDAAGSRTAVALDRLRQFTIRQREHEENRKLVKAMECAGDGILVADANLAITYANPALEKLLGVERAAIVGKPMSIAGHFISNPAQLAEIITAGKEWKPWNGKLEIRKEGRNMVLDATLSPVGEPGQPQGGYVTVLRDITGEEQLNRAKDFFVHVTAHELRTPLTKLNLCTYLLKEASTHATKQRESLDNCGRILSEAYGNFNQIAETTSVLTDLASPRTGESRTTSITAVLSQCVEETRSRLTLEGRGVQLVTGNALPRNAMADIAPDHLAKAVMEVLSNAVKYTPDGKTVTLTAFIAGEDAVIEVVDEGSGITEEDRKHIFTPFFSMEETMHHSSGRYKFKGGGLGLGLSVTKIIMEYYGGAIKVERMENNNGTKISLCLPLLP